MKQIKSLQREGESEYAFATRIGTTQVQLKRWLKNNAHFDSEGDIYIKTKGKIDMSENKNASYKLNEEEFNRELKMKMKGKDGAWWDLLNKSIPQKQTK